MQDTNDSTNGTVQSPRRAARAWRLTLLAGALVVLIAAGAGTLLAFAARQSWRIELFCHFRVQYFWGLVAACTALAILRRRVLMLVAAALAAVNLVTIVPLYFEPDAVPAASKTYRALSLNVHFLNRDFAPTLELIRREQPDVMILAEITPAWAEALEAIAEEYPYSHVIPSHSPGGIALFSRHKIADVEVKRLADVRLPTIIADVELPDGKVTVIGTHPASPSSETNAEFRNEQLAEIAGLAVQRQGPVLVMGDLNTTSWSPYFQDLLQASGLVDSRLGFGVQPSWPWFPLPLRIPIDHCLVSPDVSIVDRRVGPAVGSDHRPIVVDFAF